MISSEIGTIGRTYTYDTLGNLVLEKEGNKTTDYQYNRLNQLIAKEEEGKIYTFSYDKRGNRITETGREAGRTYVYDETNRMVSGTNWKGDISEYTYNGLGKRINNTQKPESGNVYIRDYVIDYTSLENDDLMVYAAGNGQLEYVQQHVYAGTERLEQFTDGDGYERCLYVHEDTMGNTRYYTKGTGQNFADLIYDAWGMPKSPNKLLDNDHGNYVTATYTGHVFDPILDIYFAEARYYDAANRTWMTTDPAKSGINWYQYCESNPIIYMDPDGRLALSVIAVSALIGGATNLVSDLIEQANDGKDFSVGQLLIKTGAGIVSGALGGTGITPLAIAGSVVIDVAAEAGVMYIRDEDFNYDGMKKLLVTGMSSLASAGVSEGISAGLQKVAGKWYPTRYKTETSLFRPTKDDALEEIIHSMKIGGRNSFEWNIYKDELLEQLFTRTGRSGVDNRISNKINSFFTKLAGSKTSEYVRRNLAIRKF